MCSVSDRFTLPKTKKSVAINVRELSMCRQDYKQQQNVLKLYQYRLQSVEQDNSI